MGPQQTLKVFSLLLMGLTEAVVPKNLFLYSLFSIASPPQGIGISIDRKIEFDKIYSHHLAPCPDSRAYPKMLCLILSKWHFNPSGYVTLKPVKFKLNSLMLVIKSTWL